MNEKERRNFWEIVITLHYFDTKIDHNWRRISKTSKKDRHQNSPCILVFRQFLTDRQGKHAQDMSTRNINRNRKGGGGQILKRKKDTRYTSNVSSSWFRAERRVSPFPRASHGRKNRGWREEGGRGGGGEDEDGDLEGDETWYNAWMFRFTKIVPFLQRLCCLCQVEFKGCE